VILQPSPSILVDERLIVFFPLPSSFVLRTSADKKGEGVGCLSPNSLALWERVVSYQPCFNSNLGEG
jgi:hypothetical protein